MQMIDKEELLELLGDAEQDAKLEDECEAEAINKCIRLVKGMKAVEVVHGRWEDVEFRFTQIKEKCSVCGGFVYAHGFNYCPNCGAKMDGGDKDG